MHRVKKVAFCTRPQFVMTFRVSNAPFFTRNNSHLDLSRLYHTPRLVNENQECHPLFCHSFLPLTKTRRLVLVGTPEARFSPSRAFPSLSTRRMSVGLSGCCTHRWCPSAQHSDSWPYWFGWAKVANKRMRVNLAGRIGFLLWVFSENSNIIQRKPGNIRKFAIR